MPVQQSSLACSLSDGFFVPAPGSVKFSDLGLLSQRSPPCTSSCGVQCLRLALAEFAGLSLFL